MAESLYVQALERVARDIARFELVQLVHHREIPVRRLEWTDVREIVGITVRFTDQRAVRGGPATNEREILGYPCHVIAVVAREKDLQPSTKAIFRLRQELYRHFNNRRTMEDLAFEDDEDPLPTTVTEGPRPPAEYSNVNQHVYTWTVWAWFIEPRESA